MLSKFTKLCLFGGGIWLILIGVFLCLDAFLPKEKPTSAATPVVEFLIGFGLFVSGAFLARRFQLKKTPTVN